MIPSRDLVYPPFLARRDLAVRRAAARGANYWSTCLFRSVEESDALHEKFLAGGARAAPGGRSSHNFGLASDEALVIQPSPKRVLRWGPRDFDILGEEAQKLGLHWGVKYGDKPHISWPGFVSAKELEPLLKIWHENKILLLLPRLQQVWEHVRTHTPKLPEI